MSIRVALNHRTIYEYDRPVTLSPQVIRLRPAPHCRTPVTGYSLKITPGGHFLNWQQDPQSNYLARAVFPEKTRQFVVEVDLVADMKVINPFDFFLEPYAEEFPFRYEPWLRKELAPYLDAQVPGPRLRAVLDSLPSAPMRSMDFLVALNQQLQKSIAYVIRMEPGIQTCEETLQIGSGSCRDSAWLQVQILRNLGLAARFVSGYLIQLKPDEKPLEGPEGPTADFTDLHAWTEVYLPGAGWIGLDATSGLLAGEGHLPLAATPDASSAAPITGLVGECEVKFEHHMRLTRVYEAPRVTKPYTEEQWAVIETLGHRIDEEILNHDIRLTMGGEPTFVSIDDMEGEEWNTDALGPQKRELSGILLRRLRDRFGPGGFLHFGQGKWYPGESLPRWSLACHWRRDGEPIWRDPALVGEDGKDYGYTEDTARQFGAALARHLDLDPQFVQSCFEDPLHYMQQEQNLPVNVDPIDNRLNQPEERERVRRVFYRGLERPSGYILPLNRHDGQWRTGKWVVRSPQIFLIPGDSPMGYRLPISSLGWVEKGDARQHFEPDPMSQFPPLPRPPRRESVPPSSPLMQPRDFRPGVEESRIPGVLPGSPGAAVSHDPGRVPLHGESAAWVVRTALCTEARNGQLFVFLPPLERAEDYLDLIAAIEDTAAELQMPVFVEGYSLPHDPRLNHFKITPDPGVIEVNLHPAHSWDELVRNTTTLYEEARLSRLGTEKFMLDGRHSGTGGGNHVVIGGPTAPDSPLLRRPHLLRSLVAYWLNHPSLSYLFSGMFVGPTSQAPRVDETRQDSLHELEIAFAQIPDDDSSCPPWLVDRIFRHLLVDVTGNTHRSEFCIDKLYSPDSASGRHGLVELRAFEMPPHARMSLTQQLLLRSLVAWFWREPYNRRIIHWGTELHDRFLLPHFVERDFEDVVGEVNRAGYPLKAEWFAPHQEFRFPLHGVVNHAGIQMELRQAIEPWYVLGEEPAGGGTARYVDSSVERLQLKVRGFVEGRFVIGCNGRRVPLHGTGTNGEFVAGIRFRAWQPPSCLHPTIGVHSPLVFDVIDTWTGRSVGGCTYHVSHPGGRNYDVFPVNANEAEARRTSRFFAIGHTPGPMPEPVREDSARYPFTLDLRRPLQTS